MKRWRVAGINFEHSHMGDNLRMAFEHPEVEVVGISDTDPLRMAWAIERFEIEDARVFSDYRQCLEQTRPDVVLMCPATAAHAQWTGLVAPYGVHILMEKPFASTLAEADAMIAAMPADRQLAINWPLAWYPSHRTAKRLIDEGRIGAVIEVHYYDGNRGPLWHVAGKEDTTAEYVEREKPHSWFYRESAGGGSLLDYLGYGTTLGTWYHGGAVPIEVTAVAHVPAGLEVDEQSVTVARYAAGLSTYQTRWGTFTDPWTLQPQPKCGFVIKGTAGTISSYDYEPVVHLQTLGAPEAAALPVDTLQPPFQNPVQYFLDCLVRDKMVEGPLSLAVARVGQQIVDTARQSVQEKRTVPLLG